MLSNLKVVLVSPLQSGNVGSVCRAMANMGVSDLWVVNPRILDNAWEDGEKLACHAGGILESRHTVATLSEAVADCAAVVGTSAREGLYRQHHRTPREAAPEILRIARRMIRDGNRESRLARITMKKGTMHCGGEITVFLTAV